MKELDRGIRIKRNICIVLGIICLLLFGFWMILREFTVSTVYVEGNRHYSAAEIRRMVESGWFGDNSIMLSLKYSNRSITNIPFIERMDVSVLSIAIPDKFVTHGNVDKLRAELGIDARSIAERILEEIRR